MEYSFEFSERLIDSAEAIRGNHPTEEEADRAILYLACLSCEISLKATLENVGYSKKEIKGFSHKLNVLLNEVASCRLKSSSRIASEIRAKTVVSGTANGTVGTLLTAEISDASIYPNEIRYGEIVRHYPPGAMLDCAKIVNAWCKDNLSELERAKQ